MRQNRLRHSGAVSRLLEDWTSAVLVLRRKTSNSNGGLGEVFNPTAVSQIEGVYGQARYGYVAGTNSAGELRMQNSNGVVIKLTAERRGWPCPLAPMAPLSC